MASKALSIGKTHSHIATKKEKNSERWSWVKRLVKEDMEILF